VSLRQHPAAQQHGVRVDAVVLGLAAALSAD
jgi:hypothetical protein